MGQMIGLRVHLPAEGHSPSLEGASEWLNSPSLTASGLRGKVVVIDFCTYTCIKWIRTLPYVRAWAERYEDHGLVVLGVHTPEFTFEKDLENVREALSQMRVTYPIAVDSDHTIWEALFIDGGSPGAAVGSDVDADGVGELIEQRMYQLIRQHRPIRDHLFEIELLDPGAEAFALTFG